MKQSLTAFIITILILTTPTFSQTSIFRGMIKPVNVRDDNSSYKKEAGSIHYLRDSSTGRWTYTVLWRDAYIPVSGDRWGRHGGVDIDCDQGTPIYAVADGYLSFNWSPSLVVGHNGGWGGTIIQQVDNIPGYGTVYFSYHHLSRYNRELLEKKQQNSNGGVWIPIGYLLGYSGGSSGDPMAGNSTGDHLDFRANKNKEPWYPRLPSWVNSYAAKVKFVSEAVNIPDSWEYYVQGYKQYEPLFTKPPQSLQEYENTVPPVANSTYDPMLLIQQFAVEVGKRQDGSLNQRILDCWNRNGKSVGVGVVYADNGTLDNWNPAHVHIWGNLECQNFQDGSNTGIIIDNPSRNSAFWIHGGFWQMYRYNNGPRDYGVPYTDEIPNWKDTNGDYGQQDKIYASAQEFDFVVMLWDGQEVLVKPKTVHIAGNHDLEPTPTPIPVSTATPTPTPVANVVVTVLPPSLNLGEVNINTQSTQEYFEVKNTSNYSINVEVVVERPFFLTNGEETDNKTEVFSISPNDTYPVFVQFNSGEPGGFSKDAIIKINGQVIEQKVILNGRARATTPTPTLIPVATATPTPTYGIAHLPTPQSGRWEKSKYPILSNDASGNQWFGSFRGLFCLKDDQGYKLYFNGLRSNFFETGLATSPDGITWQEVPANPVLPLTMQAWSSYRVMLKAVIKRDDIYYAFYGGNSVNLDATSSIGVATSADGIHWSPYAGNPVLSCNAFPQEGSLSIINVYLKDNQFCLYFRFGKNLYFSTSTDGIHWNTAAAPSHLSHLALDLISSMRFDGTQFYSYKFIDLDGMADNDGSQSKYDDKDAILLFTSPDAVNWTERSEYWCYWPGRKEWQHDSYGGTHEGYDSLLLEPDKNRIRIFFASYPYVSEYRKVGYADFYDETVLTTLTPTTTPVSTEVSIVTVTDDWNSYEDLSNGFDSDAADERKLVIRWNLQRAGVSTGISRTKVQVRVNDADYIDLTGLSNAQERLVWDVKNVSSPGLYQLGPKDRTKYQFRVIVVTIDGKELVIGESGVVDYYVGPPPQATPTVPTTPTPTKTNTPSLTFTPASPPTVAPTSTPTLSERMPVWIGGEIDAEADISGSSDRDPANERDLVIHWDVAATGFAPADVVDVVIYDWFNDDETYSYVGQTGGNDAQQYVWSGAEDHATGPLGGTHKLFVYFLLKQENEPPQFSPAFTHLGVVNFVEEPVDYDTTPTTVATPYSTATAVKAHTPTETPKPSMTPTPTGALILENSPTATSTPSATPSPIPIATTTPTYTPTPSPIVWEQLDIIDSDARSLNEGNSIEEVNKGTTNLSFEANLQTDQVDSWSVYFAVRIKDAKQKVVAGDLYEVSFDVSGYQPWSKLKVVALLQEWSQQKGVMTDLSSETPQGTPPSNLGETVSVIVKCTGNPTEADPYTIMVVRIGGSLGTYEFKNVQIQRMTPR